MHTTLSNKLPALRATKKFAFAEYVPLFVVMFLFLVGSLSSDRFIQVNNILNIFQYSAEPAIIAIGMMFVVLGRGI